MEFNKFKTLPANVEAENEVLSSILKDNSGINEVIDELEPNDFYKTYNNKLFEAMVKLNSKNIAIDPITIIDFIGKDNVDQIGGVTYISELLASGLRNVSLKKYAQIIKDKSNRRKLIKASQELIEKAYQEDEEVTDIVNSVQDKLLETTKIQDNMIYTDEKLMIKTIEAIEKRYQDGGAIPGMRTGLRLLDNAINGMSKGELTIIAARPSMGKTVFALNLTDGLAKNGYKSSLFEMEMTAESLGMRRLAAIGYMDATFLKRGKLQDKDFETILRKSNELASRNNVFTDCSVNLSIQDIRARAKRIKQQHGLDVIVIDHLTLMKMPKADRRDLQVGEITMGLKNLAKELDVAVILLSQLSRSVEQRTDKRPMLSDLRDSGSIEQDADTIMFLYRDEYYNKETDKKGVLEVILAKQRDGATGTLNFFYKPEYQLVTEFMAR